MLRNKLIYIATFVGFMLVNNSMSIMKIPWGNTYYGVLIATFVFLFLEKTGKINAPMFLLYIISALSIAANDVPDFFKAWPRLGLFIMLTALISPAFMTDKAIKFKTQMFATVLYLLILVMIISLFLFFTGGGYSTTYYNPYFQGAMNHSMTMGPVAALSSLFSLFQLQYPHTKKMKYALYIFLVGSIFCVMQAGSRAAFLGTMASLLAFLYFRNKEYFIIVVRKYIVYISIVVFTTPFWMAYMDQIVRKNKGESGLNTDSRSVLWKQRIEEWESSPIWGIGFSSVDAEAGQSYSFDIKTGQVETGSSWLCILSMTGILGFICVVVIFVGAFKRGYKIMQSSNATGSFLLSIMIFYMFHMMAEGYIFAGGNFLSTILWLTLGTIYSIAYMPEYGDILEKKLKIKLDIKLPIFMK